VLARVVLASTIVIFASIPLIRSIRSWSLRRPLVRCKSLGRSRYAASLHQLGGAVHGATELIRGVPELRTSGSSSEFLL
jgi:hypothetical protein